MDGWKYYNHAIIPDCAPHEVPDLEPINDGTIWGKQEFKGALFARWTTNFDCKEETDWWYIIKDKPFDINSLKAKRRYEINKGLKNFDVVEIDPLKFKDELYGVQVAAFAAYPKKYRPSVDKEKFFTTLVSWSEENIKVYGAFFKETQEICGYAYLRINSHCCDFAVLKTKPNFESFAVNAAIVYSILNSFENRLNKQFYICDGSRSISHETNFQHYLEKYFGFRKAYCRLNIVYRPKIKILIKLLYPFRKILKIFDKINFFHNINSVLVMEEITRKQK